MAEMQAVNNSTNEVQPLYSKKGATLMAMGVLVALIVGVGTATLVLIFVGVLGGQTYALAETQLTSLSSNAVNNTFTALINQSVQLSHGDIIPGTLVLFNQTNSQIGIGNFSINYALGRMNLTTLSLNGSSLNASYTYGDVNITDAIKAAAVNGFQALNTTSQYVPLIVLAVIIGLVLTMVVGLQGLRGNGGNGGYSGAL